MRRRNFISLVVVIIAAFAAYYGYTKIRKALTYSEVSLTSAPVNELPSMDISSFRLEETDGRELVWALTAKKAEMFKNTGKILFTEVDTLVNGGKQSKDNYKINSEQGAYFMNEDKVVLEKNVNITTSHGYNILTDRLEYSVKTKKTKSSSPVKISGKTPGGESLFIEGVGIEGDLAKGDFKITKKINTRFGKNLEIESKEALFNTNTSVVMFKNGLKAKKSGLDIEGEQLLVNYSPKGEIQDIEVLGDVKIKAGPKKYALCEKAVIKGGSSEITLTGKPEFHVDDDTIVGKKIVFFADSDEVYVEKVRAEVSEKTVRKKK